VAVSFDENNKLLIFIAICFVPYFIYRTTQKSVNWLMKFTPNYDRNFFITYWIYKKKKVRNEVFHDQGTTQNALIPFCKLSGGFKSEQSP
jgi:hypothetical protein